MGRRRSQEKPYVYEGTILNQALGVAAVLRLTWRSPTLDPSAQQHHQNGYPGGHREPRDHRGAGRVGEGRKQ